MQSSIFECLETCRRSWPKMAAPWPPRSPGPLSARTVALRCDRLQSSPRRIFHARPLQGCQMRPREQAALGRVLELREAFVEDGRARRRPPGAAPACDPVWRSKVASSVACEQCSSERARQPGLGGSPPRPRGADAGHGATMGAAFGGGSESAFGLGAWSGLWACRSEKVRGLRSPRAPKAQWTALAAHARGSAAQGVWLVMFHHISDQGKCPRSRSRSGPGTVESNGLSLARAKSVTPKARLSWYASFHRPWPPRPA